MLPGLLLGDSSVQAPYLHLPLFRWDFLVLEEQAVSAVSGSRPDFRWMMLACPPPPPPCVLLASHWLPSTPRPPDMPTPPAPSTGAVEQRLPQTTASGASFPPATHLLESITPSDKSGGSAESSLSPPPKPTPESHFATAEDTLENFKPWRAGWLLFFFFFCLSRPLGFYRLWQRL